MNGFKGVKSISLGFKILFFKGLQIDEMSILSFLRGGSMILNSFLFQSDENRGRNFYSYEEKLQLHETTESSVQVILQHYTEEDKRG